MQQRLDKRIEATARKWEVRYDRVVETATSIIAFGSRHDQHVVLKIVRAPGDEWNAGAVAAAFDGNGVVPVLAHEPGAVLLLRLQPARQLTDIVRAGDDGDACAAIAGVVRQMQNVQPDQSLGVIAQTWAKGFERYLASGDTQIDVQLVVAAQDLYAQLCATQRSPRLLHGDLQHYNILYDEQLGWTAIDPKGVVAELEFEFGAALRNPHGAPQLYANAGVVEQRLRALSSGLPVDGQRIRQWAFAQAVLSAIWTIEDDGRLAQDDAALVLAVALQSS